MVKRCRLCGKSYATIEELTACVFECAKQQYEISKKKMKDQK